MTVLNSGAAMDLVLTFCISSNSSFLFFDFRVRYKCNVILLSKIGGLVGYKPVLSVPTKIVLHFLIQRNPKNAQCKVGFKETINPWNQRT